MKPTLLILCILITASLAGCASPGDSPVTPNPDGGTPPGSTPVSSTPTVDPQGGAVYIDSTDLLIAESFPVQVSLRIAGNLPTPCHEFRSSVAHPDAENRIYVNAWSESDPAAMCAQVLQPFELSVAIPMGGEADGSYSVWLNGELVGEFSYPG
jgi:hypothetical protein